MCVQCCKYPALSVYIFVYAIYMALCMQDSQWTVRKKKIIKDFKLKKVLFLNTNSPEKIDLTRTAEVRRAGVVY